MNIFILDEDPVIAAQQQCDKHVVKMIVESGQMLSTAHRLLDGRPVTELSRNGRRLTVWRLDDPYMETTLYKSVHPKHPSTLWTCESISNYIWHYSHFLALCDEYEYRYEKIHSTRTKLEEALSRLPQNIPQKRELTPFKLAMKSNPECMKEDAIESYRLFYMTKQKRFKMDWKKREIPDWFLVDETPLCGVQL